LDCHGFIVSPFQVDLSQKPGNLEPVEVMEFEPSLLQLWDSPDFSGVSGEKLNSAFRNILCQNRHRRHVYHLQMPESEREHVHR
jgi:hypothetical protein